MGWRDEGTTECYALQAGVEIGQRLGLSEDTARQMMRQQLVENALRSRARPAYLVPPDCRDGGRLDLKPDVARFRRRLDWAQPALEMRQARTSGSAYLP
jgi:hypothetical protein